jgi:hypothetical protein
MTKAMLEQVRRRVRSKEMAAELKVSPRKFREIVILGMPYTRVGGILWFEPDKVHAWLDQFNRIGKMGVKRVKDVPVPKDGDELPRRLQ